MNDLRSLLDVAEAAGRAAADLQRARPARVDHKGAIDLVTEIDLACEARIRELLAPTGIPVQGEEGGGVRTGTRWVVDPLDGTTNFVHDYPFYCVSIGLIDGDRPVGGCIVDPVRDHVYRAADGAGATRNGARIHVSDCRDLDHALAVTGFPYGRREQAELYLRYLARVIQKTQGLRRSGSAAMDLCCVASGCVDTFWEFHLNPWDTCAGAVLVAEAGGRLTEIDGGPWTPDSPVVLATNGWLQEAFVALFAGLERPT